MKKAEIWLEKHAADIYAGMVIGACIVFGMMFFA